MSEQGDPEVDNQISVDEALAGVSDAMGAQDAPTPIFPLPAENSGSLSLAPDCPSPAYGEVIFIEAVYPTTDAEVELLITASQGGVPVYGESWTASGKNSPWLVGAELAGGEWDKTVTADVSLKLTCGDLLLASADLSIPVDLS